MQPQVLFGTAANSRLERPRTVLRNALHWVGQFPVFTGIDYSLHPHFKFELVFDPPRKADTDRRVMLQRQKSHPLVARGGTAEELYKYATVTRVLVRKHPNHSTFSQNVRHLVKRPSFVNDL